MERGPVVFETRSPTGAPSFVESPTTSNRVERLVHIATGKVWATLDKGQLVILNKVWQKQLEQDMGISIPSGKREVYEGKKFVLKRDGALFNKAFLKVWLPRFENKLEWR